MSTVSDLSVIDDEDEEMADAVSDADTEIAGPAGYVAPKFR